jgi:hypothetical protein
VPRPQPAPPPDIPRTPPAPDTKVPVPEPPRTWPIPPAGPTSPGAGAMAAGMIIWHLLDPPVAYCPTREAQQNELKRCQDACRGGETARENYCRSLPDPRMRARCWTKVHESEQNCLNWCYFEWGK